MWIALVAAIAAVHFYLQEKNKRRLAYTAHIQGQTEQAESMTFAVTLFEDETEAEWQKKLDKALYLTEKRRSFQNERLLNIQRLEQERLMKAKEAKQEIKAVQKPV